MNHPIAAIKTNGKRNAAAWVRQGLTQRLSSIPDVKRFADLRLGYWEPLRLQSPET